MAGGAKINVISQIADSVLAAIRAAVTQLTTANYTVNQISDSNLSRNAISIQPSSGDARGLLDISPHGTDTSSEIALYGNAARDGTEFASFLEFEGGAELAVVSADLTDDFNIKVTGNAGEKAFTIKQDGSLTLPGALIFSSSNVFMSTEVTGNGSAQNTAHGLGRTPVIAIAYITATAGSDTISAVTSDGTNCTVTAHTGTKYRILAF